MTRFAPKASASVMTTVTLLLFSAPAWSQIPDLYRRSELEKPPYAAPLDAGLQALEAGRREEALNHLNRALWHDPSADEILVGILQCAEEGSDEHHWWAHKLSRANLDAKGKLKMPRPKKSLMPKDRWPSRLSTARAKALSELSRAASKLKPQGKKGLGAHWKARWMARVAWMLMQESPALREAHAEVFLASRARCEPTPDAIVSALTQEMNVALEASDPQTALEAARILVGLATQAAYATGSEMSEAMQEAWALGISGREKARELLEAYVTAPYAIEDLEKMSRAERLAFTERHVVASNPAAVMSLEGLYRIETTCGHGTLLGVAKTIDLHHHRLASWFGEDPFEDRTGVVRIVPEFADMEAEGAPYWWAGGFQEGDRTTVHFSCSSIHDLGHLITHELTHRFDQVLYPGLPSWIAEGRAVFTDKAYAVASDREFKDNRVGFADIEQAYIKGYGNRETLSGMLDGTIDYRDNYDGGYALYAYLRTWERNGRRPFAGNLEAYQKSRFEDALDAVSLFEAYFADGRDGRPRGMAAFSEGFQQFLEGFYWKSRAPWTARYENAQPPTRSPMLVYDGPTWTYDRVRDVPVPGQGHLAHAGDFLHARGNLEAAASSWLMALELDEWKPQRARKLIDVLEGSGQPELAWLVHDENRRLFGEERTGRKRAPQWDTLPKCRALAEVYQECLTDYRSKGLSDLASRLAAEHNQWSDRFGVDRVPVHPEGVEEKTLEVFGTEVDGGDQSLGRYGWAEDELTHYQRHRSPDAWYVATDGGVHVGRSRPRQGSGVVDQQSYVRHVFVRSERWMEPGQYAIEANLTFTTAYVSGALVFGHTRKDRNVRLLFTAGNRGYANRQGDEFQDFRSVSFRLSSQRQRDANLAGTDEATPFKFKRPSRSMSLRILVDRSEAHLFVNDRFLRSFSTVHGLPLEGFVGFAVDRGALRVDRASFQRYDWRADQGADLDWPRGLDVDRAISQPVEQILHRHVRGLPLDEHGTLIVWVPVPGPEKADPRPLVDKAVQAMKKIRSVFDDRGFSQRLVVAPPKSFGDSELQRLERDLGSVLGDDFGLLPHERVDPFDPPSGSSDQGRTYWLMFVDSQGILRAAHSMSPEAVRLSEALVRWAIVYRSRKGELPFAEEGE